MRRSFIDRAVGPITPGKLGATLGVLAYIVIFMALPWLHGWAQFGILVVLPAIPMGFLGMLVGRWLARARRKVA
jgi:hypothetical protein